MSTAKEKKNILTDGASKGGKLDRPNTFEGIVVGVSGNKLVMANKEGKQYSHTLDEDAHLTCDGTSCKAHELTSGTKIRVTTKKNDRRVATEVEALGTNSNFAQIG